MKNQNRHILSPVFFIFLFYISIWWLQIGERLGHRFGRDIRLEAIVAIILLFITSFDTFRKKQDEKAGFSPFILSLFFIMLLQVAFAWNPERAWYVFTERVLKYSAMALFISRFVRTPLQFKWFIFIWILSCWKGMSEGVIGGVTGSLVWENQGIPRLHGNGLWSHPNSFSQFALGMIPYCFYLYPVIKKIWQKIGLITLFIFSTYVVIYTGSRTGYLGYIIMLIMFFFQSTKKVRKALLCLAIFVAPITTVLMPVEYQERFMSSFKGQEKEGASKNARITLYKEGWYVFQNHPFGVGVGNYPEAGMKYFKYKQEQHCLYTEVLTELGIHGFVVFSALLWKIHIVLRNSKKRIDKLIRVFKTNDYSKTENIKFINAICQSTQLFFYLRLFLDIFGMDLYGIIWWFIIGIASSIVFLLDKYNMQIEQEN